MATFFVVNVVCAPPWCMIHRSLLTTAAQMEVSRTTIQGLLFLFPILAIACALIGRLIPTFGGMARVCWQRRGHTCWGCLPLLLACPLPLLACPAVSVRIPVLAVVLECLAMIRWSCLQRLNQSVHGHLTCHVLLPRVQGRPSSVPATRSGSDGPLCPPLS